MGGNISKKRARKPHGPRERLLQARGETYGRLWEGLEEGYLQPRGELGRDWSSLSCEGQTYSEGQFMNTPWKNPVKERGKLKYGRQCMNNVGEDDKDLVGVAVRPKIPLREMTYKLAIDMSHFIKEKGDWKGYITVRGDIKSWICTWKMRKE
ncbi:truncated nef protein [Simian immunodeficiency virus]|uniref:Protein Nef n=1 Tax=Simian immunodeficiency virus TaxID=11723 RepID=K4MLS5_SIV|nr:truncated nef protein [Simian immunodeficiency virus]